MTRVLITGGTGDLGSHLLPLLTNSRNTVRIMSRGSRKAGFDVSIEWAQASIESGDGLAQAVAGVDVIAHLASDATKPQQIDVQGIASLLRHAEKAGVGHFVYISITGIEQIPFGYYIAKLEAERIIERSAVPWTILRATQFHSLMPKLFLLPAIKTPFIGLIPKAFKFQLMDEREAAVRLSELVGGDPAGRVDDIGGPEVLTLGEIARSYLKATGSRKLLMNLPMFGDVAQGFRQGYNAAAPRYGKVTWNEWLARTYGANDAKHVGTAQQAI